jgi:SAM-dependent methyltransferase
VVSEFEQEYFGGAGSSYIAGRDFAHIMAFAYSAFKSKTHNPVYLDIGCAFGHSIKQGEEFGLETYGIEYSGYATRRSLARASIVRGDAQSLPFDSDSFDIVSIFEVVEHLPNPESALRECFRVLRNDGLLIMSTRSEPGETYYKMNQIPRDPTHINEHEPEYWIDMLKTIGFSCKSKYAPFVVSQYPLDRPPSFIAIPVSLFNVTKRVMLTYGKLPLALRYRLEGPVRIMLGVYLSDRKNSFYLVGKKRKAEAVDDD